MASLEGVVSWNTTSGIPEVGALGAGFEKKGDKSGAPVSLFPNSVLGFRSLGAIFVAIVVFRCG